MGQFEVQLPEKRRDEIGRLAWAINQMSLRLKALIQGHKQFLGNVAHELTSPVVRIKLGLGILEQEIPERYRPRLRQVMEDAEHMSGLLEELLSFSRAELNPARASLVDAKLLPLAQKAAQRENHSGAEISLEIPGGLTVHADPDLLTRVLCNLVRNAIRHAGMAGPIQVRAAVEGDLVRVAVIDRGPGVPEDDLPRIFEPFHQTEGGGKKSSGVGSGLSIVKTCVEACGGTVSCRNLGEGGFGVAMVFQAGRNGGGT